MTKKKIPSSKRLSAINKLGAKPSAKMNPGDFWQLKFLSEEMFHSISIRKIQEKDLRILLLEKQILDMKIKLTEGQIKTQGDLIQTKDKAYHECVSKIESEYELTLNDCSISEETYEIIR